MKKKNQTTTIPKLSNDLIRLAPSYVTIKDLSKYKNLNTESVQKLIDKGFEGYVNKTIFKQQHNGVQSDIFET